MNEDYITTDEALIERLIGLAIIQGHLNFNEADALLALEHLKSLIYSDAVLHISIEKALFQKKVMANAYPCD